MTTERIGYQAPPLDGIWASAPYLHNGSVPTLHALLDSSTTAQSLHPTALNRLRPLRRPASRLEVPVSVSDQEVAAMKRSPHEAHFLYDTSRFGLGNQGHTFGDKLSEDAADGLDRVSEDALMTSTA